MTQEEKDLLIRDLCARLPYGVKVYAGEGLAMTLKQIDYKGFCESWENEDLKCHSRWMLPYLRPMSSMAEEEKEEIAFIRDRDFQSVRKWLNDESIKETGNVCPVTCGEVDFCNKKHLDYRGLIPMGLALEAPEGMYKIN